MPKKLLKKYLILFLLWCKINSLLTESRERMSKKELVKRYILFVISLFFCGVGIAFTKHAELGVSPISSLANVISIKFDFISFGSWLIVSNLVLLLGQIILLRRNFRLIQLVQIPLSFIFGYFTDFGMWMIKDIPNEKLKVREQLTGAMFSAIVWSIFSWGFSLYVERDGVGSVYGSLSIIILIMIWMYFCMYIIFVGAYINRFCNYRKENLDISLQNHYNNRQ